MSNNKNINRKASYNAIPSAPAKAELTENRRKGKGPLTVGKAMQLSTKHIDFVFKESWSRLKAKHPNDPIGIRIMKFHRATADTISQVKPALLDLVMCQIRTIIMPLLSAEERAELDRVTLDVVLHDTVKQIFG